MMYKNPCRITLSKQALAHDMGGVTYHTTRALQGLTESDKAKSILRSKNRVMLEKLRLDRMNRSK